MTPKSELKSVMVPPEPMTVAEWAEKHRVLSPENCAMPGPYRLDVTPFLREPLESITDPDVEKLVFMKSAQVAWTDGVICNAIGYYIDHEPASMLILLPTENMAQRFSKEKLGPMFRDCVPLRGKVADSKARNTFNTILSKHFTGGHLELVGSNAPSKLSSSPIRIVLIEEPDRCSQDSGGEGNSLKLAIERSKTFHNRKIILGGSPTIAGRSEIAREYELSDQRQYFIPCPHCGTQQSLEWEHVIWEKDESVNHPVYGHHLPQTAQLQCQHCEKLFSNREKVAALIDGEWRATKPFNGVRGYQLNELYSPFPKATLGHVVEKFLEAKQHMDRGDHRLMITFNNTSLGQVWKPQGSEIDPEGLSDRFEDYPVEPMPEDVKHLTAFVDVQQNRLEVEVVGWGRSEESWGIEYAMLPGDTDNPHVWDDLREFLGQSWAASTGEAMKIAITGIDSGYRTDRVHQFCNGKQRVYATKGYPGDDKPVVDREVLRKRRYKKGHIPIGTHQGKQIIFERLKLDEPGPGYMHIPRRYGQTFYDQLTAERLVKRFSKGHEILEWHKKPGERNEALDIRVGNLAMYRLLNPQPARKKVDYKMLALEMNQGATGFINAPSNWMNR